jgi:histidinol-phosphate aminotransferase
MPWRTLSRRALIASAAAAPAIAAAGAHAAATRSREIRLSLNENALGPSPVVTKAISENLGRLHRYVDQTEVDLLARQVAALEGVRSEQVVIGEVLEPLGLYLARHRHGGTIVYSAPGYTALIDSAAPLGGKGIAIPLDSRLQNDLAGLAAAIDDRTLAVSLVNPHNPSGTVGDGAAFDGFILQAATRTLVVVDEAYLEYDELPARSAIRHVRAGANVLVFRTLAKIYGLAGLSIGYAVAPAALARGLRGAGVGAPHALSRPALVAAGAALADQAHVGRVRATVIRERDRLHAEIDRRGWTRTESRANFVFFRPTSAPRARQALERAGIAIARPFPPLDEWIRITVGTPAENDAVLDVLRELA